MRPIRHGRAGGEQRRAWDTHSHSARGEQRVLPKIPLHGPAAQLSPRVLLSKIEEPSAALQMPSNMGDMPSKGLDDPRNVVEPQCRQPMLPLKELKKTSLSTSQKLSTMLYRRDHHQRPQLEQSMLIIERTDHDAPVDVPDDRTIEAASVMSNTASTATLGFGHLGLNGTDKLPSLAAETPSSRVSASPKPLNRITVNARSSCGDTTETHGRASLLGIHTPRDRTAKMEAAAAHRRRIDALKKSFRITYEDLDQEMLELDAYLKTLKRNNGLHSKMESAVEMLKRKTNSRTSIAKAQRMSVTHTDAGSPVNQLLTGNAHFEQGNIPEPPILGLNDLLACFERSALGHMPTKPVEPAKGIPKEEQGTISEKAKEEEILLAAAVLNFYRKLCGLQPVQLDERLILSLDVVCQGLLPRPPVRVRRNAPQLQRIQKFANQMVDYCTRDGGRSVVLHSEGSLVSSIIQCITSVHTLSEDQVLKKMDYHRKLQAINELRTRAQKYDIMSEGQRGKMNRVPALGGMERGRIHLHDLPPMLQSLKVLWEIEDGPEAQVPPGSKERRRPPTSSNGHSRPRTGLGSSKSRQIAWGADTPRTPRGPVCDTPVFWGDRTGAVIFRRYLLNPELISFGLARRHDTCALWTGAHVADNEEEEESAGGSVLPSKGDSKNKADEAKQSFSKPPSSRARRKGSLGSTSNSLNGDSRVDVVNFPPPGFFPLEFFRDARVAWTIAPASSLYQPTQATMIQMWRVRFNKELDAAERLEEVAIERLSIDCSCRGNPFCVIFQPNLPKITDGDQFEVVLNGLRGQNTELIFFHEFRLFRGARIDANLVHEASKCRSVLDDPKLWSKSALHSGSKDSNGTEEDKQNEQVVSKVQFSRDKHAKAASQIEPVSHPELTIHTETVDVNITVRCPEACAMRTQLHLVRVSGQEEIRRATLVYKLGDHFLVRVKLPMAHCRYELSFKISTSDDPDVLFEKDFRYKIISAETCQNLLISTEHPLKDKFGYAVLQHTSHMFGVTVISPVTHRLTTAGYTYFLLHIDDKCPNHFRQPTAEPGVAHVPPFLARNLFASRLAPESAGNERKSVRGGMDADLIRSKASPSLRKLMPGKEEKLAAIAGRQTGSSGPEDAHRKAETPQEEKIVCAISELHEVLDQGLGPHVQDARGGVHVDVSIDDATYVLPLRQREDFPQLYEGYIRFWEEDVASKVELFLRFPRGQPGAYAPYKLGEWLVIRDEPFPIGF